ncbi:hypothetical protein EU524_02015 [Candidatus Thorarchaeota archaeon]|nr:MAG: hypothetical protein EU524_02015 [Candidatus Thorarchaeota archaeon]
MGRAKEEWLKRISVLDRVQVWSNHLHTALPSVFFFLLYGTYLWIICSSRHVILGGLLLFFSQIAIGLPASRAYYDIGASTKTELKMFDSAVLRSRDSLKEIKIGIGEIHLAFERLLLDIRRSVRTVLDDYTDMSWFSVSVWAVVSTALYYFELLPVGLCLLGDVILAIACTTSYLGGYWMMAGESFEDDLDHLEYYTLKRLKVLDSIVGSMESSILLIAAKRGRKLLLVDFVAEFKPSKQVTVEYHVGLPSDRLERFVVDAPESVISQAKAILANSDIVRKGKWLPEKVRTPSGLILRFVNSSNGIDITNSRSYLKDPESLEESSDEFRTALVELLKFLK